MRAFGCHVIWILPLGLFDLHTRPFQPPSYLVLSLIPVIDQIDGPERLRCSCHVMSLF